MSLIYLVLLAACFTVQVLLTTSEYVRRCYNVADYQLCLSTDPSLTLRWVDAKQYCREHNSSRLVSITSTEVQNAVTQFRSDTSIFASNGVWIDVSTVAINSFHWITGLNIAGKPEVANQVSDANRFGSLTINNNRLAYYAQTYSSLAYYICQRIGVSCGDGFSRQTTCYKKYSNEAVTWFTASNRCLVMNASLATFNGLDEPSSDTDLVSWLNVTDTTRYWIGLVRSWFNTTASDGSAVDVQFTNWAAGKPSTNAESGKCVIVSANTSWDDNFDCSTSQAFVCQEIVNSSLSSSTTVSSTAVSKSDLYCSTSAPITTPVSGPGLSSTPVQVPNSASESTKLIIGVVIGVGVPLIIVAIVIIILVVRRRKYGPKATNSPKESRDSDEPNADASTNVQQSPAQGDASYAVVQRKEKPTNQHAGKSAETNGKVQGEVLYADIVPAQKRYSGENDDVGRQQQQRNEDQSVIYSDIVVTSSI